MFFFYGFLLIVSVVESIQYTNLPYTIRDVDLSSLQFNTSITTFTDNCPLDSIVLPFSFPFYDRHVSHVWIAADGYISLKPSPPCYCYFSVTNCNLETNRYDAIIAPYLTDLNPMKGTNATSIRYRIESDRLYVIWDSVPDYDREHFNSFMVILHKEGDIVFVYKNIQWPFRRTGYIHNGLIGIRPYINFHNYTTRGLYQLTKNVEWNTIIMGNYVEFEDINSIVSQFCQPSQFIYNRVELFLLTPTEICVTPSIVYQSDKLNFTVTFSTLQSHYVTPSSIRCVFGSKISTSVQFLSSQKLLCIQPNLTSLQILNSLDVNVSLEVYSNVNGQWYSLSQTTPSFITVYSDHVNTTLLYDTCNGLGDCDLCGYCYYNTSTSVLLPDQCLGSDHTPYTPSQSDCVGDQIVDDSGKCCPSDQVDCLGHCEGQYAIGHDIVDMSLFCCLSDHIDCAGICDGQAKLDLCGICSGGITDHIANSDCDCRGVCFGTEVTNCYVVVSTSNTTLEYFFTYNRQVSQSHSVVLRNDGEFSMIILEQTPSILNYGLSPTVMIEYFYNGEKVDIENVVILPHTQIELNITADISQIGKNGFSFAHRKRQIIDLTLTPLTRNETEGVNITIDLLFHVTNCNEVDSITTCSLLPHCYACTYSLDTSAYSYYLSHPFSLFAIHSPSSVDTVVFSCLNGDDVSVCSSILDEVKERQRQRLLHFSWDLFNSFQVIGILGICLVIFAIILLDVIRLKKEKRFVSDMNLS